MQTRSFALGLTTLLVVACAEFPDEMPIKGRFDNEITNKDAPDAGDPSADGGAFERVESTNSDKNGVDGNTPAAAQMPLPLVEPAGDQGTAPLDPSSDPATPTTTSSTRTCQTARDLGALSGDTGTPSVSAQGTCSDWLRVRVTEDWHGITPGTMKLTATLISPAREDFDVIVYLNPSADTLECSAAREKSELPTGRSDVAKASWGETLTFNRGDDSRTVSIEVKKKNGQCSSQPWSLLLQGHY